MQHTDEDWILAQLALSDHPPFRAVRRVSCVPLFGARFTSHHFRVELDPPPSGAPWLFLKRYSSTRSDVDVMREAAALRWLARQGFGNESMRIPRVVAVDSSRRALLLIFHTGESLMRRLHRGLWLARMSSAAAERTLTLARQAGRMLAELHALPAPPDLLGMTARIALTRYQENMERRVSRLLAVGVDTARLQDAWQDLRSEILSCPPRLQHSDFGPWNVLVGHDDALVLFDFHNFTAGHPAYDLAYMHLALEGTRRLRLTHPATVERAQRALIDGYKDGGGSLDPHALQAFRIMHVAYFAHPLVTRHRSARMLVYGARDGRRYARRWIEQVVTAHQP